jgi:tRNA(Ile2) C34 agmatinyltransferase TiaS
MSPRDTRSARMTCPRCGLQVRTRGREPEHCPRCIAQSAGALSVRLEPSAAAGIDESRRHRAILQLAGRVLERVTP